MVAQKHHDTPAVDWTAVLLDKRLTPADLRTAGICSTRLEEQAQEAAEACMATQFYLLYRVGAATRPELAEAYRALGVRYYFHDEQGRQALVFPGGSLVFFGRLSRRGRPVAVYTSGRHFRRDLLRIKRKIAPGSLEERLLKHFPVREGPGSGGPRPGAGRPALDGEPRKWITVSLPSALVRQIEAQAREQKITRSQAVLNMLHGAAAFWAVGCWLSFFASLL